MAVNWFVSRGESEITRTPLSLYYGLENSKGLIVLTGEVGTGKTTAMRWILRRLDSSVLAAYVFNPRLSIDEFYHHVTQLLGISGWTNKSELLSTLGKVLEERHRRGLRTVIIIDEAHELSDYVLEEIRLLMNFESDNAKHLQIVLTGQPELRERLNQPNLRQLKQHVALRSILHLLFHCSEGIPRNMNNICDNAMIAAYSAGKQTISRKIIEMVADNLDMLPRRFARHRRRHARFAKRPYDAARHERRLEHSAAWRGRTVDVQARDPDERIF